MTQQPKIMPGRGHDERGVTGLETAIILIAFAVVASVFAFTVLSTGVFSAERGKETVYAGLKEAQASLSNAGSMGAVRGDVEGTNAIVKLKFVVTSAISGEEIDMTPPNTTDESAPDPDANVGAQSIMIISYSDQNQAIGTRTGPLISSARPTATLSWTRTSRLKSPSGSTTTTAPTTTSVPLQTTCT